MTAWAVRSGRALTLILTLAAAAPALAQSMPDMPGMDMGAPAKPGSAATEPAVKTDDGMGGMAGMDMSEGGTPMMAGDLGAYGMSRDASGTAWQPESTPMKGLDWAAGGWKGMVHGSVLGVYDDQGGPRGGTRAFSESMLMVMAQRPAGPGTLTLRAMLSLDPAMGPGGYPLLLQTGETADGKTPLVDRQHPHDLFMELAGLYSLPVARATSVFIYAGLPGEPALGPVTFMHRLSGMDDPAAPIAHHWLDSTHITYGVITGGLVRGSWKVEASVFKGREPDQHRWDFDRPALDSWSARLSWNPTRDWALQVSHGFIKSPEQLEPTISQRRTTASATYNRPLKGGNWQTTLAWGQNDTAGGPALNAYLAESALSLGRHTLFGRIEDADKNELFRAPSPLVGRVQTVAAFSLGYVYDIPVSRHVALGFGVVGTLDALPTAAGATYGRAPASSMTFVRLTLR